MAELSSTHLPSSQNMTLPHSGFTFLLRSELKSVCTNSAVALIPVFVLERSEWIGPDQQIANILVKQFSAIPDVISICAQFGPGEMVIWTLLGTYDREARDCVYRKEMEVCETLNLYDFDFRVSTVELVSPSELVKGGFREIFHRV